MYICITNIKAIQYVKSHDYGCCKPQIVMYMCSVQTRLSQGDGEESVTMLGSAVTNNP